MDFLIDPEKYRINLRKHDVDMLYAAAIFDGPVVEQVDGRRDYGEERRVAVGFVEAQCFVVVFTRRRSAVRIISARKGGIRDRKKYAAGFAGRSSGVEGER